MAETFVIGDPPITVEIRRRRGVRRVTLRVGRTSEAPVATVPLHLPAARVRAFALEQEGWLRRQIARAPRPVLVTPGVTLPFRGRDVLVLHRPAGPTCVEGGILHVSGRPETAGPRVAAFLKETAREACLAAAEGYAARLGRRVAKVTLRDTRARWGSCTAAGELMFCWRLALAPPAVLDYVAAHEAAHLVEMNHSDRFWRVVAELYGESRAERAWLRAEGGRLMLYDFSGRGR